MHFDLVDRVLEQTPERIVTIKQVTAAEEYLQDHFPEFPVLPGVLMVEAMVQAGRRLVQDRPEAGGARLVLGSVRALRYGSFVRPGESLRVLVSLSSASLDGVFEFKGEGAVIRGDGDSVDAPPVIAVSGRFTLRPLRVE